MYRIYNLWSLFRYDIPRFMGNIWKFRKALWVYYPFDYVGLLHFLEVGVKDMSDNIEKYGYEILTSRAKKIQKMRRAFEILNNHTEDKYQEIAELELGQIPEKFWKDNQTPEESDHIKKVIERALSIEEEEWNELILIFKGQDYSNFDPNVDFYDQFDGSGLKTWWD